MRQGPGARMGAAPAGRATRETPPPPPASAHLLCSCSRPPPPLGRYEAHHKLRYTDEALMAAAKYSSQYISDRFLPDKVGGSGCRGARGWNGLWLRLAGGGLQAAPRWRACGPAAHSTPPPAPPPALQAIDLIDEAGSRVRLRHAQLPEEARELDKELRALLKEKDAAVRCAGESQAGCSRRAMPRRAVLC